MIEITNNITTAQRLGQGVVALESTVIAHGLPRPTNLQTALRLEQIVQEPGAMPATIGIIGGKPKVGLDNDEIRLLAEESNIRKVSTRDLPIAIAERWNGATTVATTCLLAHRAA
ncbi:MAG TPA: pseudouridine-5'-phosphate glycosidase, partial [Pyrinomonadaceae bacterium]|nr:pseudouridine-5'-phosphate glycosidase [Pyrinomonadaceae bacterium]